MEKTLCVKLLYYLLYSLQPMETEDVSQYRPRSSKTGQPLILPELDIFVHLLVLLRMLDEERMDKASCFNEILQ